MAREGVRSDRGPAAALRALSAGGEPRPGGGGVPAVFRLISGGDARATGGDALGTDGRILPWHVLSRPSRWRCAGCRDRHAAWAGLAGQRARTVALPRALYHRAGHRVAAAPP